MPRKPTLSPTKFSTYLACPLRYRFTFVHPQRHLMKAKSYYSFGTTLHRVLEKFYANPERGVDVREQLDALYDESWIDAGYGSAEEMAEAYAEGKEILDKVTEELREAPITAQTIHVEKTLRKDFGEFALVGRIDRIDRHEDGRLEVVDYKSGRGYLEATGDLALACYALLVRHAFSGAAPTNLFEEAAPTVTTTLMNLRTQERDSWTPSSGELDEAEFEIGELGRFILNHEWYEIEPVRKPLCESCDFNSLCRRHPEF